MSEFYSGNHIDINGRFLTQTLSGVQRYAREQVSAMDHLIRSDTLLRAGWRWRLLVPPGVACDLDLRAIEVKAVGTGGGHRWEQFDLVRATSGSRLLCLANSGPILHRDKLVVIHDAAVFRMPRNYGWRYRLTHRALGRILARTGRIGTVSAFSRRELAQVLGRREDAIVLAPNGCDHFIGRERDDAVLGKLGVQPGRYFLFVGSPAPSKNLSVLLQAFARLGRADAKLVVAGSLAPGVFGGSGMATAPGVVPAPGRSDAEIAALYAHAAAHVFPSLYEGFGIPPLEAMASGCRVIASDIPVLREVCGEAASFFAPHDVEALADLMRKHWDDRAFGVRPFAFSDRLARFRWADSAQTLIEALIQP